MDPIPAHFPILSYVMTRFPSIGSLRQPKSPSSPSASVIDIEQPASKPDPNPHFHDSLVSRMPHLKDPSIISEMSAAVSKIAQTRSLIQTLGPRPDHESVDSARSKLAEIDLSLSAAADDGEAVAGGERERLVGAAVAAVAGGERERLEREKAMFKAIVQVDETHEAYEKMLHEAEERLRRIYNKAVTARGGGGAAAEEAEEVVEEVNEDVIRVLKEEGDVERVDLCGKKLRILPEAFGRLKRVVRLDLSSNQLQGIPDSISGTENLEELNISSNSLRSLPDSIGLLLKLKILNVSGNKLTALPDSIAQCKSLVELDASCNNLGYLPTKIGFELVNLRKLLVQYNKIRSLPTSVGEMKSLELLDIHFNELRVLPRTIGQLTNLITLNLSGNFSDLKELPDTFGDLLNLEELDLSNNQIHALPYSFCRLEKLRKLNLDQNPIFLPPVEVVNKGVTAVRVYMAEKWQEFLKEEEERSSRGNQEEGETGWLKRSVSKLNDVVSTVSEYLGSPRSPHDPCLNQER